MEINEFRNAIMGLAKAIPKFAQNFGDPAFLHIWYGSFQEFTLEEFQIGCRLAINTQDEFPSIKTLKGLCRGNIQDPQEIGQSIAQKIGEAIVKFGGYSGARAEEWLGELAWKVVIRHGGWWDICNIESYQAMEFLKREMAKTATSIYLQYEAHGEEKKLALPEKIDYEKKPALANALKMISGQRDIK